ncbi:MAG: hypothetical protein RL291_1486 [Pseudomonadota bacterium]|jgi:hypothetical protein
MSTPAKNLDLSPRLADPDMVFRRLIEAHRGLDAAQSADLNTRILLILANQLGDDALATAAIDLARSQLQSERSDSK